MGLTRFAAPNPQWVAQQQEQQQQQLQTIFFYATRGATLYGCM